MRGETSAGVEPAECGNYGTRQGRSVFCTDRRGTGEADDEAASRRLNARKENGELTECEERTGCGRGNIRTVRRRKRDIYEAFREVKMFDRILDMSRKNSTAYTHSVCGAGQKVAFVGSHWGRKTTQSQI